MTLLSCTMCKNILKRYDNRSNHYEMFAGIKIASIDGTRPRPIGYRNVSGCVLFWKGVMTFLLALLVK